MINSFQNPLIKNIIKLSKNRQRKKQDLIIVEGRLEIEKALVAGFKIEKYLYCPELAKNLEIKTLNKNQELLSQKVLNKISYRDKADGHLALVKPRYLLLENVFLSAKPVVLILEAIEKPGNLGAILRTAAGFQVDLIIINDLKTDIFNPNVIRSSRGAVFVKQIAVAGQADTLSWLKKNKIKSLATTPSAEKTFFKNDFTKATAIILGTEHEGLGDFWLDNAQEKIKIPMAKEIDSLNVSVSAAVILSEAFRQRQV